MSLIATGVLLTGLLVAVAYIGSWYRIEQRRQAVSVDQPGRPRADSVVLGFVANFFDTLGIGSFASTTAYLKFRGAIDDEAIPGTLNAGHALPTLTQAVIFVTAVAVAPLTLLSMIAAAVAGSWLGAGVVSRLPRRSIQLGMGVALLVAAALFLMKVIGLLPPGGEALGLTGGTLVFAIAMNFVLGALMTLGIGLYAPCLILVSLLGMNPIAAFPIMMGSCACLMPIGSLRFIREGRYDRRVAIGLALGGIPGVLLAAFVVKSLPLQWLYWLVIVVVLYAAILMLHSAWRSGRGLAPVPSGEIIDPSQR